jgi:hypothetical protein
MALTLVRAMQKGLRIQCLRCAMLTLASTREQAVLAVPVR